MLDYITITTPFREKVELAPMPNLGVGVYQIHCLITVAGPILVTGYGRDMYMELVEPVYVRQTEDQWISMDGTELGASMEKLRLYLIGDHGSAVAEWQEKYEGCLIKGISMADAIKILEDMMYSGHGPFDGDLTKFGCKIKYPDRIKGQMNNMVMEAVKQQLL